MPNILKNSTELITMYRSFAGCSNLTGEPVCGPNVTDMYWTYIDCYNLTGSPKCGDKVTNMSYTYCNCYNLTGEPVCGPNVTNMYCTYWNCYGLTGSPVCGPNVTNMGRAYYKCYNITGKPVCGEKVTIMNTAYSNCYNLTGSPVCGSNVISMYDTYSYCTNLGTNGYFYSNRINNAYMCFYERNTSRRLNLYVPSIGRNSTYNTLNTCLISNNKSLVGSSITWTNNMTTNGYYYNASYNIYIYPVDNVEQTHKIHSTIVSYTTTNISKLPKNITGLSSGYTTEVNGNTVNLYKNNIDETVTYVNFYNDQNITRIEYMSDDITNMSKSYYECRNLTGPPVCGNKVINMANTYQFCRNLTGSPACGPNVTSMRSTYKACYNLTGSPVCGSNVTNMDDAYYDCYRLTGSPACGPNVINIANAYYNCQNLTGSPVCDNNVTNIAYTYFNCRNITGSPVCGPNVTNMHETYESCIKLTGSPVCGNKVTHMKYTYYNCQNLTGRPVCGNKVTEMSYAYYNCQNLTGPPICGSATTAMTCTYYNCKKLGSNGYFYSNKISNIANCFYGRNTSNRLNLYVPNTGNTINTCLITNASSLVGTTVTWTNDMTTNGCYYNTSQNIYIYPVTNVAQVYAEKQSSTVVARYIMSSEVAPQMPSGIGYRTEDTNNNDGTTTRTIYSDGDGVTSMKFTNASGLLQVEQIKMDNITDASYMFSNCSNLTYVNTRDWNTSKLTNMDYMFYNCSSLLNESFTIADKIERVSELYSARQGINSFINAGSIDNIIKLEQYGVELDFRSWSYSSGVYTVHTTMGTMKVHDNGLVEITASDEPEAEIRLTVYYYEISGTADIDFDLSNVQSASHAFDGCTKLQ